jgi:hypothetical protein
MGAYPSGHSKETFVKFLNESNVNIKIVEAFKSLPDKVTYKDSEYKLNIISTFFSIGDTYYNFEINYYSDKAMEFLYKYEIFTDVEKAINNATKRLKEMGL